MVWGNALLVLDLAFDVVDRIARLDLERDGLAREGLHEAVMRVVRRRIIIAWRGRPSAHICTIRRG